MRILTGAVLVIVLANACVSHRGGLGPVMDWPDVPGWQQDKQSQAWPALLQNCQALSEKDPVWQGLCAQATALGEVNDEQARQFFQQNFVLREIYPARDDNPDGLITGYYEPLLHGSRQPHDDYRYPLYKRPDDLLVVELADLYPSLKGKRVRARLDEKHHVVPYYDREAIDQDGDLLKGNEIAWVNDPVALFFTHIQGSAIIQLDDGSQLSVGYDDQNGHPYYAVGKKLIEDGDIPVEKMSMQAIKQWLETHPGKADELLNANPSYIFFSVRESKPGDGPLGTLGVPLTATRSVAVDKNSITLGSPLWISTQLPARESADASAPPMPGEKFEHLVFAQDTGGAIKGRVRADLFWGNGDLAEYYAGKMRQAGRIYLLQPKSLAASAQ